MPKGSPISFLLLLVGISRDVRKAAVTFGDARTLKFTLIVQRMPMSERCEFVYLCSSLHIANVSRDCLLSLVTHIASVKYALKRN
jgi:hypothetical protein